MFCKRCGMHIHPEEAVNYGMCENCFDEYLEKDEKISINEFIEQGSK